MGACTVNPIRRTLPRRHAVFIRQQYAHSGRPNKMPQRGAQQVLT
jgi:hypothetical protein